MPNTFYDHHAHLLPHVREMFQEEIGNIPSDLDNENPEKEENIVF